MTDGSTSDLDALRSILEEAQTILETTTLPQGRSERCLELISTARAIADSMKAHPPNAAATLGSKGGRKTLATRGPDHFRKLSAMRKRRSGGRPRKQE